LTQIKGDNNLTLLPEGTVIDSAEIADHILTLKITLPAGIESVTQEQAYTSMDVLRRYCKEEDSLAGISILARTEEALREWGGNRI
ncbi:MAG: hypothetical protein ABI579_07945, partial [Candidatus Sumerlaeota bacterium]